MHMNGGRSCLPLRDSPRIFTGFPLTPTACADGASTPGPVFGAPHDRAGRTSCIDQHKANPP